MTAIRLLAVLEANTVTGPAKNLLQFASCARSGDAGPVVEVAIALFERRGAARAMRDAARNASIPVYPILERGRFDRSALPQLRAAARSYGADIVQTHSVKSHFLARLAGLERVAPWVAFHHGYTWPDVRMKLYNQLDRWSLGGAQLALTVSRPFRDELVRQGVAPGRIEIVHNAIDPQWGARAKDFEARAEMRARLGIASGDKVVLAVGRLSREKDHATLLRAVGRLRAEDCASRVRLVVVGEGPERRSLEELARTPELDGRVTFTGHAAAVEAYYGLADVAALSSLSEGSPNALLEAMAARVPAVATAVGGVPEIVTHAETALLVKPGDAAAMAAAITALLANQAMARRMAARAYERLAAEHTPAARTPPPGGNLRTRVEPRGAAR